MTETNTKVRDSKKKKNGTENNIGTVKGIVFYHRR
jgi:hypothetical protein